MKLIHALQKCNQGRPPVWLMRQAGRYLPEYRALREKYSLKTLFTTPALAAEITLMPIRRFGVDAAILFSDITMVALGLGLELEFQEGPVVTPRVTPDTNFLFLPEKLSVEAVKQVKPELSVPLIGFCGGPFTVATYLSDVKPWMQSDPKRFHQFLNHLTDLSIHMLQNQIAAGVDVVQVFESSSAELTTEEFACFSTPYLKKITQALCVPTLVFVREASRFTGQLHSFSALSVDGGQPLDEWRIKMPHTVLQGNLHPDVLLCSQTEVVQKTREILEKMNQDPAFILNLGHGVKPQTPVENVQAFVEMCKTYR